MGGIVLFTVILAIFIVWKVKYENVPASTRGRPVRQAMTPQPQTSLPPMAMYNGRESTNSTGLNADDRYNNYLDLTTSNSNTTGTDDCRETSKPSHDDFIPLTTMFSPSASAQNENGVSDQERPVDETSVSVSTNDVTSATENGSYSRLGDSTAGPNRAELQSIYDNPPATKQTEAPQTESLGPDGQGNETCGVYTLASPLGGVETTPVNTQEESQREGKFDMGDYFILEPESNTGWENGASESHAVPVKQESSAKVDNSVDSIAAEANTDNVYVQLADKL